jgi:anti-sigma B factor antagonist
MQERVVMPAEGGFGIDAEHLAADVVVLALHGDLDLHVAPALREAIASTIDRGTSSLVLDLTGVTFVDSTALGAMLGAMQRLEGRGGRLRVVVPQSDVRRVFEITLLDHVLAIDSGRDAALSALGAPTEARG